MIRHDYIADQFTRPLLQKLPKDTEEFLTAALLLEDWDPVQNISSYIVKGTRKVKVRPLSSHVRRSCEIFLKGYSGG
jgi:hypothetical protein